ncbi:MAG TPA: DUF3300 domain-containing protein [Terriglobales bacterium]
MPIFKQALSVFLSISVIFSVLGLDGCSKKPEPAQPAATEQAAQGQAPATTYAAPTADQLYQLVAPIALFPDNLVAMVLAASTYPDQVSAAYQWLQQNSNLKGQQLSEAANQQPWDASVKGLTQFSDVLNQMATNLSWTSALGDAYYNIPQSVMNAVQVMRQRAYQAGNLKSSQQQNVTVQNQAPGTAPPPTPSEAPEVTVVQPPPQTIIIQPAQPEVVYVPTYNPTVVYGAPVPVYPGYSTGAMVATSLLSFGVGIAVGAAISGGGGCCGWGYNSWGCGWNNSTVVYNHNTYISTSNTFVNRNNYYNRNVNNVNRNNINTNNINHNNLNANNVNRDNLNRNNVNANNRANNFNGSTPHFNQKYDQPQYRNQAQGSLGQQRTAGNQPNFNQQNRAGGNQPNFNQQNRAGANQNQARGGNFNQNQRQAERGYGQQPAPNSGRSAFSNYGSGGNARTNSARGEQSLAGTRGGGGGFENRGGGGAAQNRGGGGRRR